MKEMKYEQFSRLATATQIHWNEKALEVLLPLSSKSFE